MRVKIAGAGLAGLGLAWHLLKLNVDVIIYDPLGIGGGASGVSTGLLHPFPGKRAFRSWKSKEGMAATLELIDVSEKALGKPVANRNGIFRPALSQGQVDDFSLRAKEEADWRSIELPGAFSCAGLWIQEGITVYSRLYLEGLWKAIEARGARLIRERLLSADEDICVFSVGHDALTLFPQLPLKRAIGQTLLCRWKEPLPFSLVSQGHITPTEDPDLCQVGSTYEHTLTPDPKLALQLLEKAALFYPAASQFERVEIRSGVRIAPREGYRPIAGQIEPNKWVFTGLGSRGMLYHALIGEALAKAITEGLSVKDLCNCLDVS